jgi:hypothetical protein
LALPLAACSGDMPLAHETKKTTVNTTIIDKTILLMVNGLKVNKVKF